MSTEVDKQYCKTLMVNGKRLIMTSHALEGVELKLIMRRVLGCLISKEPEIICASQGWLR